MRRLKTEVAANYKLSLWLRGEHYTDTPIYISPLALALSSIINETSTVLTFGGKNRRKLRGVHVTGRCRSRVDDALGWMMMGVSDALDSPTAPQESRNVR